MNAEIIAVGSEMLTPDRVDTNSLWLTGQLNQLGIEVVAKLVIGDDRARLADAVRLSLGRSEVVILTGGLGPTEDDVTRDAVAVALGRGQTFSQDICGAIEERFRTRGRKMAEINRRQAYVVEGAEVLPNPNGTAPGQWLDVDGRAVMLLPGPPFEMKAMYEQQCLPRLKALVPPLSICTRFYRVAMVPESEVDQRIAPAYTRYTNPVTTILAAAGDIQIHLRARCETEAQAESLVDELGVQIEGLLGDRIYSKDGASLEEVIGRRLRQRGETVAVAESCTAGGVAQRLTAIPGSSQYFLGGFVTYTDAMKASLLGLSSTLLAEHSSVSQAAAEAMALGARERTGSTWAVSVTGEAGPEPSSERNPVGTVWVAVAGPKGCRSQHYRFLGDRERVRLWAAQGALDLLRREVSGI